MCEGGCIVNYLTHLLPDPKHDVICLGYQARGVLLEKSFNAQGGAKELQSELLRSRSKEFA